MATAQPANQSSLLDRWAQLPVDSVESVRFIAAALGYSQLTELQDTVFNAEGAFGERGLFAIGDTSSGKTLVPMLLYYQALLSAQLNGTPRPKMLFVVPYRALASQKQRELADEVDALCGAFGLEPLNVAISTGEYRADDAAVRFGEVDVAVVITEKIYRWCALDAEFLLRYDFLVLDEIGLVRDSSRGIKVDFILTWAHEALRLHGAGAAPRVVALATPSYDWSHYVRAYDFVAIEGGARPLELVEAAIEYGPYGILDAGAASGVLEACRLVKPHKKATFMEHASRCDIAQGYCSHAEGARWDASAPCPVSGETCINPCRCFSGGCSSTRDYVIIELCKHHVARGHQVLIFKNDREEVRRLCGKIHTALSTEGLLASPGGVDACKQEILDWCGLDEEDLSGIMEADVLEEALEPAPENDGAEIPACASASSAASYYEAFCAGVAFHSAAMPGELRAYVEDRLLERRELKVVCCTETLAYGVNSTVDAVIVADMGKLVSGGARYLTENEYRNYVGRAGRLRKGSNGRAGYVYTLVRADEEDRKQADHYANVLHAGLGERPLLSSGLFASEGVGPFYVLNLIREGATAYCDLEETVRRLPAPPGMDSARLGAQVARSVDFLKSHGLVEVPGEDGSSTLEQARRSATTPYRLTTLGERMRGYVVSSGDYLLIRDTVREVLGQVGATVDTDTFLYRLVRAQHVSANLPSAFWNAGHAARSRRLREFYCQRMEGLKRVPSWMEAFAVHGKGDERDFAVLAALLAWSEGASTSSLYRRFGIHYPLLQHLAEQVGYLVEIAEELLVAEYLATSAATVELCAKHGIPFDPYEAVAPFRCQMHGLFVSVYYGVNESVFEQLMAYLRWDGGEEALELLGAMQRGFDPGLARFMRRVGQRHRFFSKEPLPESATAGEVEDRAARARQYLRDVNAMGPLVLGFFRTCFPEVFEGVKSA